MRRIMTMIALMSALLLTTTAMAANVFFLHHSTGRYLLDEGDARGIIAGVNATDGASIQFWDHDYNEIGLRNPDGAYDGTYAIPDDNTDPDGLYRLWTTSNPARTAILANHRVIAFKSCYPASGITSTDMLDQRKNWYLEMRDVFDQHPEKIFIVMSQPPLHRLATSLAEADRARAFADWLGSAAFLSGHPNLFYFDLFDRFAQADDGSTSRNMLRYDYERSHTDADSHPNALANRTVCPQFMALILEVVKSVPTPSQEVSFGALKTMFR